jgi:hypothetical protein
MLLHCVISFLYMRVLKNIFGKYFFSYFFLCFSAFLCEASGRWFFLSGRCGSFVRTFLLQVQTCALVRSLTWHYVWTALVIRLDGEPLRVKSLFPLCRTTSSFSFFYLIFCQLCDFSLDFSPPFLKCTCLFVISLHPRYISLPFY